MGFTKITQADKAGKGVTGLANVPGLSTADMQARFDSLSNLTIDKYNGLVDELNVLKLEKRVSSNDIAALRVNADKQVEVSADGINFVATASSGHLILNENGTMQPQRARLRFKSTTLTDDAIKNETIISGIQGAQGDVGPGVPAGGSMGQVLAKKSAISYDTQWADEVQRSANGFSSYAHVKTNATHALTGNGENIKFTATADFNEGDTFSVNAVAVTASTQDGGALCEKCFQTGAEVQAFFANGKLWFCGRKNTPVLLWDGVFSGGSITVPGLARYKVFMIETNLSYAIAMIMLANGHDKFLIHCGYPSAAALQYIGTVSVLISGETLTFEYGIYNALVEGQSVGKAGACSIRKIWGLM